MNSQFIVSQLLGLIWDNGVHGRPPIEYFIIDKELSLVVV